MNSKAAFILFVIFCAIGAVIYCGARKCVAATPSETTATILASES